MKIGVFYGSTTGVTESIAQKVATLLGGDIFHAGDIEKISGYDLAILAASTWGFGDIQDDWIGPLQNLKSYNLSGKKVAIIGVGDQEAFSSSFVNGMRDLYEAASTAEATIIGFTSTDGYSFDESTAIENDKFIGLVIDEANQSSLTEDRIKSWIEFLKS
ncbi:MAG: flavodoxin [Cetobacterium sp.]|uniref:flavodoxin n=1 Tax=unclassified Cetobacterium TaxID=2630983 RepID=UPI00068F77C0|nr:MULTISPECIES: flavodoxin [unclassified Cetobacterium]